MSSRQRSRRGLAYWIISAEIPVFVVDSRRIVLVFNHACEQLTGYPVSEVIGQHCAFINPYEDKSRVPVTAALVPPDKAYYEPVFNVDRSVPLKEGDSLLKTVHFFPLREAADQGESRVLGIITDDQQAPGVTRDKTISGHAQLLQILDELRRRYQLDGVIATTPEMHRVLSQVQLVCQSTVPVHFEGESGVGKEYLARCLHSLSGGSTKLPFVPLNCDTLTHFELHHALQRAYDEQHTVSAPAGTLFFRQVGSLPRDLQEMLLSLKQREPNRWRILSSSQSPLEELRTADSCSDQFFYELTTCVVRIPPLRERRSDIPLLVQQILESWNLSSNSCLEGVDDDVLQEFVNYQWPGNVRELKSVVEEACQLCHSPQIGMQHLPFRFRAGLDAQRTGPPLKAKMQSLDDYLLLAERNRISEVMELVRGNKTAAAELLGIPRPKLYRRLEALGLVDSDPGIEIEELGSKHPDSIKDPSS